MITKTIPIVHRFIPFTFVLLCAFFFVDFSHAHADIGNSVNTLTTTDASTYNGGWTQFLGSGITGTSTDIYVDVVGYNSGFSNARYGIELDSCTDNTYTTCGGLSSYSFYQAITGDGTLHLDIVSVGGVGFAFNPALYYKMVVTRVYAPDFSSDRLFRVRGSATSPNPDWSTDAGGLGAIAFSIIGVTEAGVDPCDSGETRLCGFTPENDSVLTGPDITFTLDAWLAAQDLGTGERVHIRLRNIDQNVLLLGALSPNEKTILDRTFSPGDDGHFAFSTSTPLADGNYRVEAWLEKSIFFGFLKNPFESGNDQVISKQFIVGTSTYIGNLSQNGFNILNGTLAGKSATSSLALVARCNPLGSFDMVDCLSGLLIPDANQVNATIAGMRDGILTRLPWGYFTRFAVIVSSTATSSLPTFTAEVAQNDASDTTTLSFDPGDMLAGGGALVDSIHDPYNNKTIKDIFGPIVQLVVALMVLFEIVSDLTGSHKHAGPSSPGDIASKRRRV